MLRIIWLLEGRLNDPDKWIATGDVLTCYADLNRAKQVAQTASFEASGLGPIEWREGPRNPFLDMREVHGYVADDDVPAFKIHPRDVDHRTG
jgi:hypothetical protein